MLKLRRGKPAYVPVALGGGALIRVRPATQTDVENASARAQRDLMGLVAGSEAALPLAEILGDDFNLSALEDTDRVVAAGSRLAELYIVLACQDGWSGIGTEDGVPIDKPDPATLAMLLADPVRHSRIMGVVNSAVHEELEEKNGSAASLNGAAAIQTGVPPAGAPVNPVLSAALSMATLASAAVARKSRTRHKRQRAAR